MSTTANNLIQENEVIRSQVGFFESCVKKWKSASEQKESKWEASTQLNQTIFYLKEGLEDFYSREDNLLPQFEFSTKDKTLYQHKTIIDSLRDVCQVLLDLRPKGIQVNKEHLLENIDILCRAITSLSLQENEILKPHINQI